MLQNNSVEKNNLKANYNLINVATVCIVIFFVCEEIISVLFFAVFYIFTNNYPVMLYLKSNEISNYIYLYIPHFIGILCAILYVKKQIFLKICTGNIKIRLCKSTYIIWLIVFIFSSILSSSLTAVLENAFNISQVKIMPQTVFAILFMFCYMCIIIPITEEILFRGLLQTMFQKVNVTFSIIVVSLIFTFMHKSIVQMPAIFLQSIILCIVFYKTKKILVCILFHFINNTIAFFMLLLQKQIPIVFSSVVSIIVLTAIFFIWHTNVLKNVNKYAKQIKKSLPYLKAYLSSPLAVVLLIIFTINAIRGYV